uniref:Uncharacterized protein n=1 Tax=Peronospora matthiolae TaxID=2874970 RepID=A0AAV1TJS0_9STRA
MRLTVSSIKSTAPFQLRGPLTNQGTSGHPLFHFAARPISTTKSTSNPNVTNKSQL